MLFQNKDRETKVDAFPLWLWPGTWNSLFSNFTALPRGLEAVFFTLRSEFYCIVLRLLFLSLFAFGCCDEGRDPDPLQEERAYSTHITFSFNKKVFYLNCCCLYMLVCICLGAGKGRAEVSSHLPP